MGLPTTDLQQPTCCVSLNECLPLNEDSLECSTWHPMVEETTATSDNPVGLVEIELMERDY